MCGQVRSFHFHHHPAPSIGQTIFSLNTMKGWQAALGCTFESLALFRISLGLLLILELVLRYRFLLPFYSNEGTLPLPLLLDKVDDLYKAVCLHCHFGELWQQQVLLSVQVLLAGLFTVGYKTLWTSVLSWYLYLSLTLRNTWMNYILDRYFHHLLFLSMFLPLDQRWAIRSKQQSQQQQLVLSPGTVAIKALVVWIYLDAGWGKYSDPLQGWMYHADPLPALDTYARHTLMARYLYAAVGPEGLRLMTPAVVYVELLAAPVALVASVQKSRPLLCGAIGVIVSLHVGIALTLRNSALLSLVACVAWCPFLPVGWDTLEDARQMAGPPESTTPQQRLSKTTLQLASNTLGTAVSLVCIVSVVTGNFWLESMSRACDQSVRHIWSTVLHNRWNVFVGAEEYVTWEIAPGLLKDGSIVDIWTRSDTVDWSLPGSGAPCTSTARPGRWRSFPYLAGLQGADAEALWSYLCREWNREHPTPEQELVKFNFFMLQADVLPSMGFGPTRKRLIQTYECISSGQEEVGTATESMPDNHDEL